MKTISKQSIVISIILLLIGVSVSSAISVDTESTLSNKESEECRDCNEISDADLIRVERLLDRVEVYSKLLMVLTKHNSELKDINKVFINEITLLRETFVEHPICDLLYIIGGILESNWEFFGNWMANSKYNSLGYKIANLCCGITLILIASTVKVGRILDCEWT